MWTCDFSVMAEDLTAVSQLRVRQVSVCLFLAASLTYALTVNVCEF